MNFIKMIGTIRSVINTNDNSKQERQREMITRLKFIGTFQPGEKIDVTNLRVESDNFFTPFKRMLFGEGRDKTLSFLNITIERTFEIIQSYVHTERLSEKIYCSNIVNDLVKAVCGLKHIQETYRDDKMFTCNVDSLIESVDAKLMEIREKYPEIINSSNASIATTSTPSSPIPISLSNSSITSSVENLPQQ